ncbi:MAG TPA: HAD-IB family hydrolase [Nocardioidaceae bacterium]|nr:HAD-IB family hydrolase [Nocardioidaceae bacterium]
MKPEDLLAEVEAGPRGPQIGAFFDLDGTLVHGFTATHIFRDRIRNGQVAISDLAKMVLTAVDGSLGGDPTRIGDIGLGALRGHLEDQMQELGERLFVQKIAGTIRPQARAIVKAHLQMGHTVVLASAATRYQTEPVARDLGIDNILCTELEVEDGVLTGKVRGKFLWGEPKAQAVRSFAKARGIDLGISYGYANGDEDVPFLASTGKPHAIAPHRALLATANLQGWPVLAMAEPITTGLRSVIGTIGALGGLNAGLVGGAALGLLRGDRQAGLNVGLPMACDAALSIAGVKVNLVGEENLWRARPAIFIGNHQSSLDPIIMGALLRTDFTAVGKKEAKYDPRTLAASMFFNPVYINRSDPTAAIEELNKLVERVQSGTSIMIFPEGTRMPTPEPGRFKKGAFHMAMQAGVPIVPVVFRNAGELMGPHAKVISPGTVDVAVLDPIDTSQWTVDDLNRIVDDVRQLYIDTLEKWPS